MEFKRILLDKKNICKFLLLIVIAAGIYLYRTSADPDYLRQQSDHAAAYLDYIEGVVTQSDSISSISIFQKKDSYSSRNIEKTKNAYEPLLELTLEEGNFQGIETVIQFNAKEVISFLFGFLMVLCLFEDEKKGLKTLCYSTRNGRFGLAVSRICALAAGNALFVTILYTVLYICSGIRFGSPGNILAPVQSLILFKNYVLPVSILVYIVTDIIIHILISFAASLFIWMIMLCFRNHILSTGTLVLILAIEGILCYFVPTQSVIVALKYINIISLIWPQSILYYYSNFNLFGYPVSCFSVILVLSAMIILVSGTVCIQISRLRKPVGNPNFLSELVVKLISAIKLLFHRFISNLSLIGAEFYKIFIIQKGILFFAFFLIIMISRVDISPVMEFETSSLMLEVYGEYSGPDDGRLREFVLAQEKEISDVQKEYEDAAQQYEQGVIDEEAFENAARKLNSYVGKTTRIEMIREKLEYMDKMKQEKNLSVWFINEKAYEILCTENGLYVHTEYRDQEYNAIITVCFLILLLCSVFSYDRKNNIMPLLYTTKYGRNRLMYKKLLFAGICCLFLWGITYGLELFEIQMTYPMTSLKAPVQSLKFLSDFPIQMSIGVFLVLLEIIHFITLYAIAVLICLITCLLKGVKGIGASMFILLGPAVLKIIGFSWMEYISIIQPVVFVEPLVEHGLLYSMLSFLFVVLLGLTSFFVLRFRYQKAL